MKVRVLEVDLKRNRIALTMRLEDGARQGSGRPAGGAPAPRDPRAAPIQPAPAGAMALALARLKR